MFGGAFVGNIEQPALWIPKVVIERMMHDHSYKGPHDDRRIDFDYGAIPLPFTDVGYEILVNPLHELVEEHLSEFMFFECRM